MTQGHVAATQMMCCSHTGDIKQGHVTGKCSRDKIRTCTHMKDEAEKFVREVLQGHIPRVIWHINENEFRFIKTQGNSNDTVAKHIEQKVFK